MKTEIESYAEQQSNYQRTLQRRLHRATFTNWDGLQDRLAAEILPDGKPRIYEYATLDAIVPLAFSDYPSVDVALERSVAPSTSSPIPSASSMAIWSPWGDVRMRRSLVGKDGSAQRKGLAAAA